jgi:hypothetical protein
VHHSAEVEFLVFVYQDPTQTLGEDEVKLHVKKHGLEIVPVTPDFNPVMYEWAKISKILAQRTSEDPGEMDMLIFSVNNVGTLTFEAEDARAIRRACASFHPTLLLGSTDAAAAAHSKPMGKGESNGVLKALHIYTKMNHLTKILLVKEALRLKVPEGDFLFREGEPVNGFYIVVSGLLSVTSGEKAVAELQTGQPFGQTAFIKDQAATRTTSVQAATGYGDNEVIVLMVTTELFESIKSRRYDFVPGLRKCPLDLAEFHEELATTMRDDKHEVFVFNDPTGTLPTEEDASIGIYCSKVGLQILEVTGEKSFKVLLSYHWSKIMDIKAKLQAEEEPDVMEVVEFTVKGVGHFSFECENGIDLRTDMANYARHHHPHHVHNDTAESSKFDSNEHLGK